MTKKICPYCGVLCEKNNLGEYMCPNCGLVPQLEEEDKNKKRSYIN